MRFRGPQAHGDSSAWYKLRIVAGTPLGSCPPKRLRLLRRGESSRGYDPGVTGRPIYDLKLGVGALRQPIRKVGINISSKDHRAPGSGMLLGSVTVTSPVTATYPDPPLPPASVSPLNPVKLYVPRPSILLVKRSNVQTSVLVENTATSAVLVRANVSATAPPPGSEPLVIWLGPKAAQVAEGSPEQLTLNVVALEYLVELIEKL
jgi:hypothetical protein